MMAQTTGPKVTPEGEKKGKVVTATPINSFSWTASASRSGHTDSSARSTSAAPWYSSARRREPSRILSGQHHTPQTKSSYIFSETSPVPPREAAELMNPLNRDARTYGH